MTETDFFEGGAKSLSFGKVNSPEAAAVFGLWRGGLIEHIGEPRQQTNWETGELEYWSKSGDPIMQLPITLNTAQGQYPEVPLDGDDDLVRTYYCTKGKQEFRALRDALAKAKVKAPVVGGTLYVRWFEGVGIVNDGRKFEFIYYPPAGAADSFLNGGGQQPPAAPTQQAPQQAAPQQQMPPQVPPGQPQQQWSAPAGQPGPIANTPQQVMANHPQAQFDPHTGQPIQQQAPAPAAPEQPAFDPATGAPLNDAARAVLAQHAAPTQQPAPAAPQHAAPVQQQAPVNPYA
jgi:hypothetical protein